MFIFLYKTFIGHNEGEAECVRVLLKELAFRCSQSERSASWGRSKRGSGGRVEQPLDHLLHFLRSILVILLGVLGEGDVGASRRNRKDRHVSVTGSDHRRF